eukprot:m51a1_g2981 hypothetical protein (568) ;mRNA; f:720145-721848
MAAESCQPPCEPPPVSLTPLPDEPESALDAALRSAWDVRTLVLPRIASRSSLLSLALSCPPCLAAPAMLLCARPGPVVFSAVDALVAACAARDSAVVRRALSSPLLAARRVSAWGDKDLAACVVWTCTYLLVTPEAHRALLEVVPAARAAPSEPPASPRVLFAAACPAGAGSSAGEEKELEGVASGLRALLGSGIENKLAKMTPSRNLAWACESGALSIVRLCRLGLIPASSTQNACTTSRDAISHAEIRDCLARACRCRSPTAADVVRELSYSPFRAVRDDALAVHALLTACSSGNHDVVRALSAPPFLLGACEARAGPVPALVAACRNGHYRVVRVLARPPYGLSATDAQEALVEACSSGRARVVLELTKEPYLAHQSVGAAGITSAVVAAVRHGHTDVVRVLAKAPFDAHAVIGEHGKALALRAACKSGSAQMIAELALAPWNIGGDIARESGVLAVACAAKSGDDAVRALAQPPYCLRGEDARAKKCLALREALATGRAKCIRALAQEPYGLGKEDVRAALPGLRICPDTADVIGEDPWFISKDDIAACGAEIGYWSDSDDES